MDEMNDELRKMIEQDDATLKTTRAITVMYKGFIDSGMPEHVAIDFVKFWIEKAMNQINITGSNNGNE